MNKKSLSLVFLCLVFAVPVSAKSVQLPIIADVNGLIMTEFEVDGQKSKFLLDTGGGANFLDVDYLTATAAKSKTLKRSEKQDQAVASATARAQAKAYEWSLNVHGIGFDPMLTFEQNTRRFSQKLDGIDCCSGILGIPFLKQYPVAIDRDRKEIVLGEEALERARGMDVLPVQVVQDRFVRLVCRSSLGADLELRLDSGSEVPLILQPRFIDQYQLVERVEQVTGKPAARLPVIGFGKLNCGDALKDVQTDALLFTARQGALGHAFVDGNLGPAILGRKYVLDLAHGKIYFDSQTVSHDIRRAEMGKPVEITLQGRTAGIDEKMSRLEVAAVQKRLARGLDGLTPKEMFAAARLLLSAASENNEKLGFSILEKLRDSEIPCVDYYRAEWYLRKGYPDKTLKAIKQFEQKEHRGCSPALVRNASGLRALANHYVKASDLELKLPLAATKTDLKAPLVLWNGMAFLVDTGAEHHLWNLDCQSELKLGIDKKAHYGGQDSTGKTLVADFAMPKIALFGKKTLPLAGFAYDLRSSGEEYARLLPEKTKFCGILSPQRLLPKGLVVFDWSAQALLLCQNDRCRKSLDLPMTCPLYQFEGRPYFSGSVSGGGDRLFLVDTGATVTSANLNYFPIPPKTERISTKSRGVAHSEIEGMVIPEGRVSVCGQNYRVKPMSVRPASTGSEWKENGKIGMDLLLESLIAVDFARGTALLK